jgi:hypothetical protein
MMANADKTERTDARMDDSFASDRKRDGLREHQAATIVGRLGRVDSGPGTTCPGFRAPGSSRSELDLALGRPYI